MREGRRLNSPHAEVVYDLYDLLLKQVEQNVTRRYELSVRIVFSQVLSTVSVVDFQEPHISFLLSVVVSIDHDGSCDESDNAEGQGYDDEDGV